MFSLFNNDTDTDESLSDELWGKYSFATKTSDELLGQHEEKRGEAVEEQNISTENGATTKYESVPETAEEPFANDKQAATVAPASEPVMEEVKVKEEPKDDLYAFMFRSDIPKQESEEETRESTEATAVTDIVKEEAEGTILSATENTRTEVEEFTTAVFTPANEENKETDDVAEAAADVKKIINLHDFSHLSENESKETDAPSLIEIIPSAADEELLRKEQEESIFMDPAKRIATDAYVEADAALVQVKLDIIEHEKKLTELNKLITEESQLLTRLYEEQGDMERQHLVDALSETGRTYEEVMMFLKAITKQ